MAGSEREQRDETRAKEDMVAKWGLTGFVQGRAKHVSDEEMLDTVPEAPTRQQIQEMLRQEFGNTKDTEYLLDDLKEIWDTFDLLIEIFSVEDARKMINAPPDSALS